MHASMINSNMKLEQLLQEGPRDRKQVNRWRKGLSFEKQLQFLRDFIKQTSDATVMNIYQQATRDQRFDPSDLKTVRQVMMKHDWDEDVIQALV